VLVLATGSKALAVEDGTFVVEIGTGPMKEHSWLKSKVSRVLIAQQNVPCLLLKGEKLVCCAIK
jgi:hypothetical protein